MTEELLEVRNVKYANDLLSNVDNYFRGFNFKGCIFSNANLFRKDLGLGYAELLKIWNHYSNKEKEMKCMHCKFQRIRIPNELNNLTPRLNKYSKNHKTKYIPCGLFCFIQKNPTIELLQYFEQNNQNQNQNQEQQNNNKKILWEAIKNNNNLLPQDFIGICCYYCYNNFLLGNQYIMEGCGCEMDVDMNETDLEVYNYNYILPYLMKKGKCIVYKNNHYCSKNVEKLNCEENKNIKNHILENNLIDYKNNISLFICSEHMTRLN